MPGSSPPTREYLIEYYIVGASVKVTAVDPVTGKEATIVGPANAGRELLKRNAIRKLEYLLTRKD
jgi:hypothetical protein